jgi:transglutaminase-like putative cysteine protease
METINMIRQVPIAALTASLCLAAPHGALAAEDRYYSVSMDGKAIGYDHMIVSRAASGVTVTDDTLIKISALGSPLDIATQSISKYGANGSAPASFVETVTRPGGVVVYKVTFGKGNAHWTLDNAGAKTATDSALKAGTMLVAGTDSWEAILRKTTPVMRRFTVPTFDPQLGKTGELTLTRTPSVKGDELWSGTFETVMGPQPLTLRYRRAGGGVVTSMEFPAQKISMRLAGKEALKNFGSLDYTSHLFTAVDTPLPNPDALTVLKLRVSAKVKIEKITPASLQHGSRQAFRGTVKDGKIDGVFTIHPGRYDGKQAPTFPYASSLTSGQLKWLKPAAFIESDDPEIKALARKLTAPAKTGWDAASAIGRWVHDNIRYEITGSGARQCLTKSAGDCGPHSWLSIALCRAAGIPARIAGGALYTPLAGGSYAQHYWTEAWMGPRDGWVPFDSTTGEVGTFSPSHLTLWSLGSLDSLSVKVLDFAPKNPKSQSAAAAIPRRANGLSVGYKEQYDFIIDGKNQGSQTAALISVQNGGQHWTYTLDLKVPQGEKFIEVTQNGSFDIAETGEPIALASSSSGGIATKSEFTFAPDKIAASLTIGGVATPRTIPLASPVFLFLSNVLTSWSLATRSVTLPTDKPTTLPTFLPEALQTIPMTFTPKSAETVTVGDAVIPCHVYTIDPIGCSVSIADTDGRLLKLTDDRQKLVVLLK